MLFGPRSAGRDGVAEVAEMAERSCSARLEEPQIG